ncbi:hypothetical protein M8J73_28505 [Streptomyces neyagawaensis]|nr:hypothetical protein [Streptomyces neyagawaensis]
MFRRGGGARHLRGEPLHPRHEDVRLVDGALGGPQMRGGRERVARVGELAGPVQLGRREHEAVLRLFGVTGDGEHDVGGVVRTEPGEGGGRRRRTAGQLTEAGLRALQGRDRVAFQGAQLVEGGRGDVEASLGHRAAGEDLLQQGPLLARRQRAGGLVEPLPEPEGRLHLAARVRQGVGEGLGRHRARPGDGEAEFLGARTDAVVRLHQQSAAPLVQVRQRGQMLFEGSGRRRPQRRAPLAPDE